MRQEVAAAGIASVAHWAITHSGRCRVLATVGGQLARKREERCGGCGGWEEARRDCLAQGMPRGMPSDHQRLN